MSIKEPSREQIPSLTSLAPQMALWAPGGPSLRLPKTSQDPETINYNQKYIFDKNILFSAH